MLDKIIEFLRDYVKNIDETIRLVGKYKTISAGLLALIDRKSFTQDELRKCLSVYTKRIISENEFSQLLNYEEVEYTRILYEV